MISSPHRTILTTRSAFMERPMILRFCAPMPVQIETEVLLVFGLSVKPTRQAPSLPELLNLVMFFTVHKIESSRYGWLYHILLSGVVDGEVHAVI